MSIGEQLQRRLEEVTEERDALAAHVEHIKQQWDYLTDYCNYDEMLVRMAACFSETPATSLDHLKAEWQAEAFEEMSEAIYGMDPRERPGVDAATEAARRAKELRHQDEDPQQ